MINLEGIGKNVWYFRDLRGKSRKEIAETAGISYKFLGDIERGNANPSAEILILLATVLGIELDELVRQDPKEVCLQPDNHISVLQPLLEQYPYSVQIKLIDVFRRMLLGFETTIEMPEFQEYIYQQYKQMKQQIADDKQTNKASPDEVCLT